MRPECLDEHVSSHIFMFIARKYTSNPLLSKVGLFPFNKKCVNIHAWCRHPACDLPSKPKTNSPRVHELTLVIRNTCRDDELHQIWNVNWGLCSLQLPKKPQ